LGERDQLLSTFESKKSIFSQMAKQVILGATFASDKAMHRYATISYNFLPAAVEERNGSMRIWTDSNEQQSANNVHVALSLDLADSEPISYKGKLASGKLDCVLIWDEERQLYVLEKASVVNLFRSHAIPASTSSASKLKRKRRRERIASAERAKDELVDKESLQTAKRQRSVAQEVDEEVDGGRDVLRMSSKTIASARAELLVEDNLEMMRQQQREREQHRVQPASKTYVGTLALNDSDDESESSSSSESSSTFGDDDIDSVPKSNNHEPTEL
jgi:RNA polymerase II transcription elongation factor